MMNNADNYDLDELLYRYRNPISDIMGSDSCAYELMSKDLEQRLEAKLKGVHKNQIYLIKDGRYKTCNPQICRATRLEVLIALYEFYFKETPLPRRKKNTIKNIYPQWIHTLELRVEQGHRGYGTLKHYQSDYRTYLMGTDIENRDISKITYSDIKLFYEAITSKQAITRKCLNNVKTLINQIFDYARDHDIRVIDTHDIRTTDLICKESDNSDLVYTDHERDRIIATCKAHDDVYARCIGLMFCQCVRIGEIKALKWSDIDFINRRIYIHRSFVETANGETCVNRTKGKKKECNRYQSMSDLALSFLSAQKNDNPDSEYVFMSNGHPLTTNMINKKLHHICDDAGVDYLSTHKIRFWAITKMFTEDVNDSLIQYTAGHSDMATTIHYKRVARSNMTVDSDVWDSMFG
ncbi:MAG: tyrosine-type recombinase/integrase [Lachnospiraceae bacterium]|nr:tyrosine-type recombinase/integrase [Lachnospiraceae bacterium]